MYLISNIIIIKKNFFLCILGAFLAKREGIIIKDYKNLCLFTLIFFLKDIVIQLNDLKLRKKSLLDIETNSNYVYNNMNDKKNNKNNNNDEEVYNYNINNITYEIERIEIETNNEINE